VVSDQSVFIVEAENPEMFPIVIRDKETAKSRGLLGGIYMVTAIAGAPHHLDCESLDPVSSVRRKLHAPFLRRAFFHLAPPCRMSHFDTPGYKFFSTALLPLDLP
jgi:hypothetical protein